MFAMVAVGQWELLLVCFLYSCAPKASSCSCPSLEEQLSVVGGFENSCVIDTECSKGAKCCPTANGSLCWQPKYEVGRMDAQKRPGSSSDTQSPQVDFDSSMTLCPDGSRFLKYCYMKTCPHGYYCYFGICCRHTKRGLCPLRFGGGRPHGPQCDNDVECPTIMKCCSIADGWFCVYPRDYTAGTVNAEKDFPLVKGAPLTPHQKVIPPAAPNEVPFSEFPHELPNSIPIDQFVIRKPTHLIGGAGGGPPRFPNNMLPQGGDMQGGTFPHSRCSSMGCAPYPSPTSSRLISDYGYGNIVPPPRPFSFGQPIPYGGYPQFVRPVAPPVGPTPIGPLSLPMPVAPFVDYDVPGEPPIGPLSLPIPMAPFVDYDVPGELAPIGFEQTGVYMLDEG